MDQQREVLIWFINFLLWAKVNDYTDPKLLGKDPVYLIWLATTLLLAKVVLKSLFWRKKCSVKWTMFPSCKQINNNWHLNLQLNNLLWWHFPCLPRRHQLLLHFLMKNCTFPLESVEGFVAKLRTFQQMSFTAEVGAAVPPCTLLRHLLCSTCEQTGL